MKLSTAAAAININIISSTLVHASASSVRSMQASILTGKSRKDAKTSKSAKTKAAKNMSYSSSLEQPCNGGTPNAGTTCVKQTANGCELQVGPDTFPTKIDSQQQGHVVITNDGSSVEVSGSIYGGCNVAAVQYKDTFDPPRNCSPPNPGTSGAWMSLWFGAVGVSNSNIKSFNATIVDPIIPDFMGDGSVSVSYRQWGVAAQPAALPEDFTTEDGYYEEACKFEGNTSFGVYNSVFQTVLAAGNADDIAAPPGQFMLNEEIEIFGRNAWGLGTLLSQESLGKVFFSMERETTDLWRLTSRVLGTSIETSLTFSQDSLMLIFDEAAMNGDLPKNSTAYKLADENVWKWVFVPYMKKEINEVPKRLADIPRTFVNISKYEDVHIELEPDKDGNPVTPPFNTTQKLGYDDGMEITGELFGGALYLNFTTLHADYGLGGNRNDVADSLYPWRVCVVESLLAYKRGSENSMDFNYDTMSGSFNMTFENSTESSACASGVCAPTIQTCTTAYWVEWCLSVSAPTPEWCMSAADTL